MQRYSENSNSCIPCQKAHVKCSHAKGNLRDRMKELVRKRTMRPFAVIIFCFAISQFCGMTSIRPYMVQIFETFQLPINSNWATVCQFNCLVLSDFSNLFLQVVVGLMGLLANIVCMGIIKVVGKRKLIFFSLIGTGTSCFALGKLLLYFIKCNVLKFVMYCYFQGFYAFNIFPAGWSSFDKHAVVEAKDIAGGENYFAMIMFFSMAFFTSVGAAPIPWILLGEVYPFK